MSGTDLFGLALRALTYGASIAAAGSVLLALSLGASGPFARALRLQSAIGAAAFLALVPLTYVSFQLAMAGGDAIMAFSAGFRGIFFQTDQGTLAYVRLGAGLLLFLVMVLPLPSLQVRWLIAGVPALILIGTFGFEGHATSYGPRILSAALIIVHLALIHWWFAILIPLPAVPVAQQGGIAHRFGVQAAVLVPILILTGAVFFGVMTGFSWPSFEPYFQRFGVKMGLFLAILCFAAANKLWLKPGGGLGLSIRLETLIAISLLIATAYLTKTSPG